MVKYNTLLKFKSTDFFLFFNKVSQSLKITYAVPIVFILDSVALDYKLLPKESNNLFFV